MSVIVRENYLQQTYGCHISFSMLADQEANSLLRQMHYSFFLWKQYLISNTLLPLNYSFYCTFSTSISSLELITRTEVRAEMWNCLSALLRNEKTVCLEGLQNKMKTLLGIVLTLHSHTMVCVMVNFLFLAEKARRDRNKNDGGKNRESAVYLSEIFMWLWGSLVGNCWVAAFREWEKCRTRQRANENSQLVSLLPTKATSGENVVVP